MNESLMSDRLSSPLSGSIDNPRYMCVIFWFGMSIIVSRHVQLLRVLSYLSWMLFVQRFAILTDAEKGKLEIFTKLLAKINLILSCLQRKGEIF